MDHFEQKYNFRFEEGTGAYITTHQREVEDTMRRKDDKRKLERDAKKERIEDEKRRKHEELNKLKQLKRDEILEKLKKAEFIAGSKLLSEQAGGSEKKILEKIEKELKTDFIPEMYDRAMDKMFDEKYYQDGDDTKKEDRKAAKARDLNIKLLKDQDLPENDNWEDAEENDEEEELDEEQYARELAKPLKK